MRKAIIIYALFVFSVQGCNYMDTGVASETAVIKSMLPVISMAGNAVDTAYLYTVYNDPGAGILHDTDGIKSCNDFTPGAEVQGIVNTELPGTYTLQYNANNAEGFPLAPVNRTVHVLENTASFLNGTYNVACSCTVSATGSSNTTLTALSYTASVKSAPANNHFEVIPLMIGAEKVISRASLSGYSIHAGFFSSDYATTSASGTLSPSKNSFTIQTICHPYSPRVIYRCKNVYTKQLTLAAKDVE